MSQRDKEKVKNIKEIKGEKSRERKGESHRLRQRQMDRERGEKG